MKRVYFMLNGRKVYVMSGGRTEFSEERARKIVRDCSSSFRNYFIEEAE